MRLMECGLRSGLLQTTGGKDSFFRVKQWQIWQFAFQKGSLPGICRFSGKSSEWVEQLCVDLKDSGNCLEVNAQKLWCKPPNLGDFRAETGFKIRLILTAYYLFKTNTVFHAGILPIILNAPVPALFIQSYGLRLFFPGFQYAFFITQFASPIFQRR